MMVVPQNGLSKMLKTYEEEMKEEKAARGKIERREGDDGETKSSEQDHAGVGKTSTSRHRG